MAYGAPVGVAVGGAGHRAATYIFGLPVSQTHGRLVSMGGCPVWCLAEEAMALFMVEANRLSQEKRCSLHAVCVSLGRGLPLEVGCWAGGVCSQPSETVLVLTFSFHFFKTFCHLAFPSFKQI